MSPHRNRRQVLLFIVAVVVPFLVLAAISLRMIGQERELAEKRLADDQRRLVSQIRQELLARLEKIKLHEVSVLATGEGKAQAAGYENASVVLVSPVENNRVVLPWEVVNGAEQFQQLLGETKFSAQIQTGEREELVGKKFSKAAHLYREAMTQARHPAQAAYAQLLLARVLGKSGRQDESIGLYLKILSLPSELGDESGVPLWVYAADRLLGAGVGHPATLDRIRNEVSTQRWLPPAEFYILRELAQTLAEGTEAIAIREAAELILRKISDDAQQLEQALALQNDFPSLMLMQGAEGQSPDREPLWIPYGEKTWLVSLAPRLGAIQPTVIAVRAEDVFRSLDSANASSNSLPGEQAQNAELLSGHFHRLVALMCCQATATSGRRLRAARGRIAASSRTRPELLQQLIDTVATFNLRRGIVNSLDAKLENAQAALDAAHSADSSSACGMLSAFIHEVQAQSGNAISTEEATQLIYLANQVRAGLACP